MRKTLTGIVVSDRNDKTRIVTIDRTFSHAKYTKVIKKTKKLHCHDEKNVSVKGDKVVISESRPFSKLKRWVVIKVEK